MSMFVFCSFFAVKPYLPRIRRNMHLIGPYMPFFHILCMIAYFYAKITVYVIIPISEDSHEIITAEQNT